MATAPVGIAPVFTPQTFHRLAEWADESKQTQLANCLRDQVPFVLRLVEKQFRPLTSITTQKDFDKRFELYALRFEPFRLYLNAKILESLAGQNALLFYTKVLDEVVSPLVGDADAIGFSALFIRAILSDYIFVFKVLAQVTSAQAHLLDFDGFESSIDWMHSVTRLDYGLTAIFLALEGTLRFSRTTIKIALMVASGTAVVDFAKASSRFFHIAPDRLSPERLSSTRFTADIFESHKSLSLPVTRLATTSRRTLELDWLKKNMSSNAADYRGKWIVLEKNELIASDTSYDKARATAKQKGIKRPFIIFIPPPEHGGFMGI